MVRSVLQDKNLGSRVKKSGVPVLQSRKLEACLPKQPVL
jgi:rRNA-processing protein FCF1